jgi:hypothetical protein
MTPFCSSMGGASQVRETEVEVVFNTIGSVGAASGAENNEKSCIKMLILHDDTMLIHVHSFIYSIKMRLEPPFWAPLGPYHPKSEF